jgi:hypothetical protein
MLEALFQSVSSSVTSEESDATSGAQQSIPSDKEEKNNLINSLIKMIQMVQGLQLAMSKNQSVQSKVQSAISDTSLKVLTKAFDDQIAKIKEMEKKAEEAKHSGGFFSVFTKILSVIAVVAAFVFLGPIAGIVAGVLLTMQMTGATAKIFSEIHSPIGRFFEELGFALAVALVGGGLSGALDGALAASADAAASASTDVAASAGDAAANSAVTSSVEEGTEIELTSLAQQTGEEGAESEVNGAVNGTKSATAKEYAWGAFKKAGLSSLKSSGFNLGLQSLTSTSAITDLATAMAPNDKKLAMWLAVALSVLLAAVAVGGAMKMSGGSFWMTEALPNAAKTSKAWSAINTAMKFMKNPLVLGSLTAGAAGGQSYFGVKKGQAEMAEGDLKKEQGPLEAMYMLAKILVDSSSQQIKTQGDYDQKAMKGLEASISRTDELTIPTEAAARVLA